MKATHVNRYLPIVLLYFFFNSFLLPTGLLYTTILTPFFILWLFQYPSFKYLAVFFIITLPFAFVHFLNGINLYMYLRSYLLFFSVFVFGLAFWQFLKNCQTIRQLYKYILLIMIFFIIVAIGTLYIPSLRPYFWYNNEMTESVGRIQRLKLLTYEPSYLSILLVPIVLFYVLKMLLLNIKNKVLILGLLLMPLLLSLSFGVILGLLISLCFLFVFDYRLLTIRPSFPVYIVFFLMGAAMLLTILILFYPENVFFVRIANVITGKDVSFTGRTYDSFYLSWKIASVKSIWFGAGPGQVRAIGLPFFQEYYNYTFPGGQIGIPNTIADTLATYGLAGVGLRFLIQIVLFIKMRVYFNYYRLALFLFAFVYQFTGSFITNIAEYVIWIIAFSPWVFTEFNRNQILNQQAMARA